MIVIDYANLEKLCSNCNKPNTEDHWYKDCNSKLLQQNFPNWTSGNEFIDKFIQETQLNALDGFQVLEWIPFNRFKNIKYLDKIGYNANWLDGPIKSWSYDEMKWFRFKYDNGYWVNLKSLNDSSNLSKDKVLYFFSLIKSINDLF